MQNNIADGIKAIKDKWTPISKFASNIFLLVVSFVNFELQVRLMPFYTMQSCSVIARVKTKTVR